LDQVFDGGFETVDVAAQGGGFGGRGPDDLAEAGP